jgi:hypothetical protein
MRRFLRSIGFLALVATRLPAAYAQDDPLQREIGRTTEKELKIVLTSSFGTLFVSRGEPGKVLSLDAEPENKRDPLINVDYAVRNRIGYLDLALGERSADSDGKRGSFKISNWDGGRWRLKLSDDLPISFDVQLGVGKGDFDLSGLQVKDFNLSSGASDVSLSFDEPNRTTIENLNIESGLSKFDGRNLCNANFKRFRFQGGVGAYTLDFGGTLNSEVDVDIEVGMGVMTLVLPADVGARVMYQKSWVSKVDCAEDFRSSGENEYVSRNYVSSHGKMNIRIDSGFGSVKILRR